MTEYTTEGSVHGDERDIQPPEENAFKNNSKYPCRHGYYWCAGREWHKGLTTPCDACVDDLYRELADLHRELESRVDPGILDAASRRENEKDDEIEQLRAWMRDIRAAWFSHVLQSHSPEREWEDEGHRAARDARNQDLRRLYDAQTERILRGEILCLDPQCGADLDEP